MKLPARTAVNYVLFAFLFTSACMILGHAAVEYTVPEIAQASTESPSPVLLIDPGHGGEDGGASVGNILEKDLNLTVSRNLADICTIFGQNVQLTRNSDILLYDAYDDLEDYAGKKKTYDLRNRLRMAEESGASLFVGIHMNKFPQEKYKGLQVYYTPNAAGSENAARLIQTYARKYLMPENEREIKEATQAIYILDRIQMPAVLVECGFLSNPAECANLCDPAYQVKLAASVFAASMEWVSGTP
ncbi:MAG: N-acetylmuramoyl-L-alanine amidase [Clostridia bacterium]|nr:N-acetylmuramoyl-L-alanine amidase [Clostridia bacterium]